jgi:hypothetical protein
MPGFDEDQDRPFGLGRVYETRRQRRHADRERRAGYPLAGGSALNCEPRIIACMKLSSDCSGLLLSESL